MNQHTDEPRFATVTAEGINYPIYLTSPNRDYIQKNLALKGVPYELSMLTDMKSRLSVDSVVLDVGANIGNHTFYLAHVLRCQVIAFEANDELAHAMDITASEAGLVERVTVHAFALGEKPGFAEFEHAMPDNLGGQSLRKGSGRIKIRTLDSFGISAKVSAIKIDVEGMELDVLKGGKKLIERDCPILYVESQTKESFVAVSSYLKELGYCYRDTFNATPTHLFTHKTKLKNDEDVVFSALNRVEHEYDLLTANKKVKNDLVDCQMKYREICQLNSALKLENVQLQEQMKISKVSAEDGGTWLHSELEQAKQNLNSANQLIEQLREEVAGERSEKELQAQRLSEKARAGRMDAAELEKWAAEVERLSVENRNQKVLLEEQQALKFALEDSEKKCAEIAFILKNTQSEVDQGHAEKKRLLARVKDQEAEIARLVLSQTEQLEITEKLTSDFDALNAQFQQLVAANASLQLEKTRLQDEIDNLSQVLKAAQEETLKIPELEHKITSLEEQRIAHTKAIESQKVRYDQYIQGLRSLHEQQQRDNEQQMHIMIQKKIDSLMPLQANQDRLNKLIEYGNDIQKIYSDRTPLLSDFDGNANIEQIMRKKTALERLNQQLVDINNRRNP